MKSGDSLVLIEAGAADHPDVKLRRLLNLIPPDGIAYSFLHKNYETAIERSKRTFDRDLADARAAGLITKKGDGKGALYVRTQPDTNQEEPHTAD